MVGFGLSNDERRGRARDFDRAFRIAKRAGLLAVPHGGELAGPESVAECIDDLDADRVGHGVRAAESDRLMERLADRQICCEVCPTSNVGLGVAEQPWRTCRCAGCSTRGCRSRSAPTTRCCSGRGCCRSTSSPATVYGFRDAEIAELARQSIRSSAAPDSVKVELLREIDRWLAAPVEKPEAPAAVGR